jgi:shikimate kinase
LKDIAPPSAVISASQRNQSTPTLKLGDSVVINTSTVHGLIQKTVSAESLVFLETTLKELKPGLLKVFPTRQQIPPLVTHFYSTTVDNLKEIRYNIYKTVFHKIIPADDIVKVVQISLTSTNVNNSFVTQIPQLLETRFKRHLSKLKNVPKPVLRAIWNMMILNVYECMIEAFAGQSSTPAVREQFLADFESLQKVLKENIPEFQDHHKEYVETYIKGYSADAKQLEFWLNQNYANYTHNQLYLLINNGNWDRKTKSKCTGYLNNLKPAIA